MYLLPEERKKVPGTCNFVVRLITALMSLLKLIIYLIMALGVISLCYCLYKATNLLRDHDNEFRGADECTCRQTRTPDPDGEN